jgi:hypothetical protein
VSTIRKRISRELPSASIGTRLNVLYLILVYSRSQLDSQGPRISSMPAQIGDRSNDRREGVGASTATTSRALGIQGSFNRFCSATLRSCAFADGLSTKIHITKLVVYQKALGLNGFDRLRGARFASLGRTHKLSLMGTFDAHGY